MSGRDVHSFAWGSYISAWGNTPLWLVLPSPPPTMILPSTTPAAIPPRAVGIGWRDVHAMNDKMNALIDTEVDERDDGSFLPGEDANWAATRFDP
jgi:hypothetical protein